MIWRDSVPPFLKVGLQFTRQLGVAQLGNSRPGIIDAEPRESRVHCEIPIFVAGARIGRFYEEDRLRVVGLL